MLIQERRYLCVEGHTGGRIILFRDGLGCNTALYGSRGVAFQPNGNAQRPRTHPKHIFLL